MATALRLGAYDLSPGETVLVQTLFKLFGQDDTFGWSLVSAPPYDALLADGTTDAGQSAEVDSMAKAVLRLTRMHADDAPNTLQRPIRAERLQQWLNTVARDLQPAPAQAAAPAQPATRQAPQSVTRAAEPTDGATDLATDPVDSARFKLRRWPPTIALRADANRIRMATILSRRAMCVTELATLSRQSESDCRGFLMLLRSSGLVEQLQPALAVSAPATIAPPTASKPKFGLGLISGIRRRLGL